MKTAITTLQGSFAGRITFWVALFCAASAQASGQLPPEVFMERFLPNIDACSNLLNKIWHADLAEAANFPQSDDRQQLMFTNGLVVEGPQRVTYDVEYGWQFRTELPEIRQIRTNYNYDRKHYVCAGGQLTGTSTQGFTLEEYGDMPDASKGKTETAPR
ncbi:hypothetical protein NIBR502774_14345 (plasmid) [Rhizobium sp. NIBRBAC000502774]|nr:hypothetical protein NIBR502774_14345 [Rhizobium sp. NIBRBAC000502774]